MKKLRVAIVGCGGISRWHAVGHSSNPDIEEAVAVCDIVKNQAKKRAEEWGIKKVYTDYDELLRDPEIDAVDICTPTFLHAPQAIKAAEAEKHVLVEKPMAMTTEECEEMVKAAEKADVKLMYAESYFFYPPIAKLKELIDAGILGEPIRMRFKLCHNRPLVVTGHGGWRIDPTKTAGGILFDWGCHQIAVARWYMGEFESVYAIVDKRNPHTSSKPCFIDDVAMIVWRYKGGKKYGIGEVDNSGPIGRDERFEVTGTKYIGLATTALSKLKKSNGLSPLVLYNEHETHYYFESDEMRKKAEDTLGEETFRLETRHFAECTLNEKEPIVTGEDGKKVIEILEAIYKSSEEGKTVNLP